MQPSADSMCHIRAVPDDQPRRPIADGRLQEHREIAQVAGGQIGFAEMYEIDTSGGGVAGKPGERVDRVDSGCR